MVRLPLTGLSYCIAANPVRFGAARRQGWQPWSSPEHRTEYPSHRRPIAGPRSPLLRLTCLSKAPSRPSASWVRRPHPAVRPPRGFRHARRHLFYQVMILPQASVPASEFYPGSAQSAEAACFCSLEVLCPPSATQPPRATNPGRCLPGSCCVHAVPAGSDALLPR